VGRRMVPARVLRRWGAARIDAQPGSEDRLAAAVVGGAVAGRARRRVPSAMDAVRAHLVNRGARRLLLLSPPYDHADPIPDRSAPTCPASARTAGSTRTRPRGS
jgi:hypothetical protein